MSILQAVMTAPLLDSGGGSPPPPPPPSGGSTDFGWYGDDNPWYGFGTTLGNSTYSDPAPANPSYAYADGSYTGKTRNFTGTQWMVSTNLLTGGAWADNAIAINLWFYPTANDCQIMSELNQPNATLYDYHYSMLEIDSSGYIKAKFWQNGFSQFHQIITSNNTVVLNQWNHIYFTEDINGGHIFELNGVGTTGLPTYTRLKPSGAEHFSIGVSDTQQMVTANGFQGKIGYIQISDYVAASTYTANLVTRFRRELTSGVALGFNGSDNRYVIVADNLADWNLGNNWTIEWWQNIPAGAGGFMSVLCQDANVPTYSGIDIFNNNGAIQMFNGGRQMYDAAAIRDQWNHIALQNNGGTLTGYINGQPQTFNGSHSGTIAPSSPMNVCIGSRTWDGGVNFYGQYFNGQLANIRISSVARYSTAFTPPLTVEGGDNVLLAIDGSVGGGGMLVDEMTRHTLTNNGATIVTIT
jgi:hypothetical protein